MPFIWREAMKIINERAHLEYFLTALLQSHGAFITCLYILSPIDLIPELFLGIFGLIDDVLVSFMLMVLISEIQYKML
jgi:RING finger protein 170